jgi:hypothetical protein
MSIKRKKPTWRLEIWEKREWERDTSLVCPHIKVSKEHTRLAKLTFNQVIMLCYLDTGMLGVWGYSGGISELNYFWCDACNRLVEEALAPPLKEGSLRGKEKYVR